MTGRVTGQRFRQRKLSTKQNLAITRESDLDVTSLVEDESQRHVPRVETGVEKGEETEHHLQAALSAAASGRSQMSIPTPETKSTTLNYIHLYPPKFSQPATYIRFSSTVEDCTGSPYSMTVDDDVYLKNLNRKKSKPAQCTEDQFEELMSSFESTAQAKQPFASVDNPPVVPVEDMEAAFDETVSDGARAFARDVFAYWKGLRLEHFNAGLMPSLKFETGVETDDSDPYVCFRRREVRQVRKTRGRDAQVTEKLKKLRRELEDARFLLHNVRQRENLKREQQDISQLIFRERGTLKDVKRKLRITKTDDEDILVNQKPSPKPKPQPLGNAPQHRGIPGKGLKPLFTRADGRPPDVDLISLQETKARKEEEITRFIDESLSRHQNWNNGWVDITWRPITPPMEQSTRHASFRPAVTEFLPSPPTSHDSEADEGGERSSIPPHQQHFPQRPTSSSGEVVLSRGTFTDKSGAVTVCYAVPPSETFDANRPEAPSFRRRVGRGGRLMIDRRGIKRSQSGDLLSPPFSATTSVTGSPTRWQQHLTHLNGDDNERIKDRHKFDQESEDEDDTIMIDPFDTMSIRYRVALIASSRRQVPPQDAAAAAAAAQQQQQLQLQQAAAASVGGRA